MNGVVFQTALYRESPGNRRHIHEHYTINLIREGTVKFFLKGADQVIPSWTLLGINPDETHAYRALDAKGYRHDTLFIDPDILKEYQAALLFPSLSESVIGSIELTNRFAHLVDVIGQKMFDTLEYECLLQEFLDVLFLHQGVAPSDGMKKIPENDISRAKEFIHENYHRGIGMDEISSHLGFSKYHFQRLFKRATAISVHQYLMSWRVEKAKQALRRGESLVQTACACGFYDQSHLNRCFKALMGVTPGFYRAFFN